MSDTTGTSVAAPAPAPLVQRLAGEAIGTLLIVLVGCGASAVAGQGIFDAGAFGFAVVAAMIAFGRLTGGHFNPAVSIGSALSGRTSWADAGAYAGAQVAGAVVGGILLMLFAVTNEGEFFDQDLGASAFGDQGGPKLLSALLLEIVLTLLFVLLYLALTDRRNVTHAAVAPLGVGLLVVGVVGFGASTNPARSIGPALLSGTDPIIQLWLFIIGPVLGAVAAGFAYNALFGADGDPVPGSGLNFSSKPAGAGFAPQGGYPQQQWGQPAPGGYDGGFQQGYNPPAPTPSPSPAPAPQQQAEAPIVQDGWQWDPATQQWVPAQQAPGTPAAGSGWAAPSAGEQTQVRPPEGL